MGAIFLNIPGRNKIMNNVKMYYDIIIYYKFSGFNKKMKMFYNHQ